MPHVQEYQESTRTNNISKQVVTNRASHSSPQPHRSWTIGPPGPPVFPHELCCIWQAKAVLHLHGDITEGRNPEAAKRLHLMGGVGQKKNRGPGAHRFWSFDDIRRSDLLWASRFTFIHPWVSTSYTGDHRRSPFPQLSSGREWLERTKNKSVTPKGISLNCT